MMGSDDEGVKCSRQPLAAFGHGVLLLSRCRAQCVTVLVSKLHYYGRASQFHNYNSCFDSKKACIPLSFPSMMIVSFSCPIPSDDLSPKCCLI